MRKDQTRVNCPKCGEFFDLNFPHNCPPSQEKGFIEEIFGFKLW
jgi:hypothetical protein